MDVKYGFGLFGTSLYINTTPRNWVCKSEREILRWTQKSKKQNKALTYPYHIIWASDSVKEKKRCRNRWFSVSRRTWLLESVTTRGFLALLPLLLFTNPLPLLLHLLPLMPLIWLTIASEYALSYYFFF